MVLISYIFECGSASLCKGVSVCLSVTIIHKLAQMVNRMELFNLSSLPPSKLSNVSKCPIQPHLCPDLMVNASDRVYGGFSYLQSSTNK